LYHVDYGFRRVDNRFPPIACERLNGERASLYRTGESVNAPNAIASETGIRQAVVEAWDQIETDALSEYHATANVRDFDAYARLMVNLTAIASINAWRKGMWR
jgi:hypothetical protein